MATGVASRIFVLFSLCLQLCTSYEIPDVKIQALNPKGLRVSIPDAPNLSTFVFQGNVNRAIGNTDVGALSGEVIGSTNGEWVFQDPNIELKVGDVINYYVFVSVNSVGYVKDGLSFTVRALEAPGSQTATGETDCIPSVTVVRGARACAGQVIFEDNFDSLSEDVWQVEQYIPREHPEYPFVSFQRPTISIVNGSLRIAPTLQQYMPGFDEHSIYSGELNLFSGCTGSANECIMRASGASILPPIVSGRVTSKGFAFTYGTVHIRAKLPLGDWLYPEILLEPFRKKYGNLMFASGTLKIACARGNKELTVGSVDFGNKVLYGGPVMDFNCREYLLEQKRQSTFWGDDFHLYSVIWTPDQIKFQVDSEDWIVIKPDKNGMRGIFPARCTNLPRELLKMGGKMAPFDDHFYLTLSVAAGGITEFKDNFRTTNFRPKPWGNQERKGSLAFWKDVDSWLPTWNAPEMLVDYVKVVAL